MENSPEARELYLQLAGGYKPKDQAVYGLGSVTSYFYDTPPPAQGSSSSRHAGATPSTDPIVRDQLAAHSSALSQLQSQLSQVFQHQQQCGSSSSPSQYLNLSRSPQFPPHP